VGQTVTLGIISAKGRATGLGDGGFEDFLQTDAPINQGNSGGALVNTRGELIGINSQILSPSGGNIGIGFAIPATMAKSVMAQLIQHGTVRRGMLGITVQTLTSDLAASLELDSVDGALVSSVREDSAAERAGVRRGDVVTALNGVPVTDSNALRNQVATLQPGSKVELAVVRGGEKRTITAKLDELPNADRTAAARDGSPEDSGFGLAVEPVTPADAERLGAKGAEGLVVTDVSPDSPAAAAGIREGDIIAEVNGKSVRSAAELKKELSASADRPSLVLVNRRGASLFVTMSKANS
jgi:S1-C subfamily serine protease